MEPGLCLEMQLLPLVIHSQAVSNDNFSYSRYILEGRKQHMTIMYVIDRYPLMRGMS